MTDSTRLERALEVWLRFQSEGGDRDQLLAGHPELADLLVSMFDDEQPAGPLAEQVIGDFRIVREVGRGGMGVVYEARQRSLDRRIALKVLAPHLAARPVALARFKREALLLARFDHPGIVRVFDVGEDQGQNWLAMEFVDGETLAQRLDRLRASGGHSGDSLRQLVAMVADVAAALQHAHGAGLVHRDVKPANVFLRQNGAAVLGDFGLARDETAPTMTQAGTVAGTPYYMSPEQVRGAPLDARSDVFALGITLYECVTLRRPFEGSSTEVVLHKILWRDPRDPRRLRRGLPSDLAAVVMKALEKEPQRRYQTAGELAADLHAFLELRPVQARPVSTITRVRRWTRREPLQAALAATGVLALLLSVLFLLRLPEIRAAGRAQLQRDYDTAVDAGMQARNGSDQDACYRHYARALQLRPDGAEAIALLCLAIGKFDGPAAALAELERHGDADDPDLLQRARALLLRRAGRDGEAERLEHSLPPAATAFGLLIDGAKLLEPQPTPAARQRAYELLSLAVRIAPRPRLMLYVQWAALAPATSKLEGTEALLHLWPDNPLALHYAAANIQDADPNRAADLARKALALGLAEPSGRHNLAAYLRKAGRGDEALQAAQDALAHDQGLDHRLRVNLLSMLREFGDQAGVGQQCERWVQQAPDEPEALRALATWCADQGDCSRALELAERGVAVRPSDPFLNFQLGVIFMDCGRSDRARQITEALVATSPANEPAHRLLMTLLGDLKDETALLAELERWCEAIADNAEDWGQLAGVLLKMDDAANYGARALRAAENADYLTGGNDARHLRLHADALAATGNPAAAQSLRQRAERLAAGKR